MPEGTGLYPGKYAEVKRRAQVLGIKKPPRNRRLYVSSIIILVDKSVSSGLHPFLRTNISIYILPYI